MKNQTLMNNVKEVFINALCLMARSTVLRRCLLMHSVLDMITLLSLLYRKEMCTRYFSNNYIFMHIRIGEQIFVTKVLANRS